MFFSKYVFFIGSFRYNYIGDNNGLYKDKREYGD